MYPIRTLTAVMALTCLFSMAGCKKEQAPPPAPPASPPPALSSAPKKETPAPPAEPAAPEKQAGGAVDCADRDALTAEARTKGTKVLAGLTDGEIMAQVDILSAPDAHEGKKVRIAGTVTGICPGMGCWLGLRGPKGKVLNLKVVDGVVDFRKLAKLGQFAIGEGVFNKTGHHGAQVKITGAMIGPTVCNAPTKK